MQGNKAATAQLQSLANTVISASDWIECVDCHHRYRPSGMGKEGVCRTCENWLRERQARLGSILSTRAMVEHTWPRFQVTDENREAFETVLEFDFLKQSLYLFGECGVGKSHLASLVIRQAVNCGLRSIIQAEPSQMLRAINSALRESAEAEERAINRFINASLLVLDDLGVEKVTDYKLEKLYEVINGRDKAMKPGLVITSNYTLDEISERLNDDRIASRIAGLCTVVKVGGQDWRLVKAAQQE
jgi:DNA replication protein DnaC